jgi:hypothetical protein
VRWQRRLWSEVVHGPCSAHQQMKGMPAAGGKQSLESEVAGFERLGDGGRGGAA